MGKIPNTFAYTGQCRHRIPSFERTWNPPSIDWTIRASNLSLYQGWGFGRLPAIMTVVYRGFPQSFPVTVLPTLQSPAVTLCTTSLTFNNSTFCPHIVFMYFVWISEQTAIISLYSIDWLVFITDTECLLRGVDWIFKCNLG